MLVIVASYEMTPYLTNTLFSLSKYYQSLEDYEVIVFTNGGAKLPGNFFRKFGRNFQYIHIDSSIANKHPFYEINNLVKKSKYENLFINCDGARICSHNILKDYSKILQKNKFNVCTSPGYHLGPMLQRHSQDLGYDNFFEKKILKKSRWWMCPSAIFDISVSGGSTPKNFKDLPVESNSLGINKNLFLDLGGFSEGFKIPGGGQINLDLWQKICVHKSSKIFYFKNHGTFHQIHGGMSTNSKNFHLQKKLENKELNDLKIIIDKKKINEKPFQILFNGPKRILNKNDLNETTIINSLLVKDEKNYKLTDLNKIQIYEKYLLIFKMFYLIKKSFLNFKHKSRVFLERIGLHFVVKSFRKIFYK